jgi:hypothetical protein
LNRKVVYASTGVVIGFILLIFFTTYNTSPVNFDKTISNLKLPAVNVSAPIFNQEAFKDAQSLELDIASVQAQPIDNNSTNLELIFNVHNPNKGTVMLESISYNLYSNTGRIVSGDVGERPEGFVGSQANIFPIVGNGSLTIKDKKIAERDDARQSDWDNILDNSQHYIINGTFSYKQTSSFQSSGGENNFTLNFP